MFLHTRMEVIERCHHKEHTPFDGGAVRCAGMMVTRVVRAASRRSNDGNSGHSYYRLMTVIAGSAPITVQ